jgi:hypothetical protein
MFEEFYRQSPLLVWPLVGLLLFLAAFCGVLLYAVVGLRNPDRRRRLASLPLDDGAADAAESPEGR